MDYTATPVAHQTPADYLENVAAGMESEAADPDMPESVRLSLLRQVDAYRAARQLEIENRTKPPIPYPLAGALLGPSRALRLTCHALLGIAIITFVVLLVRW